MRIKIRDSLIFLKRKKEIQAQTRLAIEAGTRDCREGERREENKIPAVRVTARKRKGKCMAKNINESDLQDGSDAQDNQEEGDT